MSIEFRQNMLPLQVSLSHDYCGAIGSTALHNLRVLLLVKLPRPLDYRVRLLLGKAEAMRMMENQVLNALLKGDISIGKRYQPSGSRNTFITMNRFSPSFLYVCPYLSLKASLSMLAIGLGLESNVA